MPSSDRTPSHAPGRGGADNHGGPTGADAEGVRLQKVLAQAGVGSRRACEELIERGRVSVNGAVVRVQGMRVDPRTAVIHVDGERVPTSQDHVYLAFNKPEGVVSTMSDPEGRPSLQEYVEGRAERLFHVGRLDVESEGLLLLTNDGELAHRLAHPSFEVPKTYLVQVPGPVARDLGRRLKAGVELEDGLASVDEFRLVSSAAGRVMIEIVLHEGRNRIVRRMLGEAGYPVERLVRTRIGPVRLGDLKVGRLRTLQTPEVGGLLELVGM